MPDYDLTRNGRPAGHLSAEGENAVRAVNLLKGGGFRVEGPEPDITVHVSAVAEATDGELVRLEECVPEKPRPCELASAIAYARDLADDEGIPAFGVASIIDAGGYTSEEQVKEAIRQVYQEAPAGDIRLEAATVLVSTFPGELGTLPPDERAAVEEILRQADQEASPQA